MDRDAELSEFTALCTSDSGSPYAWWRAGAWAGKTALMPWFALHPPQGVRIVPFFITARLGAQNDVTSSPWSQRRAAACRRTTWRS